MLSQNIKNIRCAKGLSQEELAIKLNVVRQTVSKWERGLLVPDSDLLIALAEALDVQVSTLLGETVGENQADDLKAIAEKLELINAQLAEIKTRHRRILHGSCIAVCAGLVLIFIVLLMGHSGYLEWDYSDPETAVLGVGIHSLEWIYIRVAPLAFVAALVGAVITRDKRI